MKSTMALQVGDFVWAKMKGYQAWPAKIVKPAKDVKQPNSKKPMFYVYFFGTQNHAWILEENIFPYKENEEKFLKNKDKVSEAKRRTSFWAAVDAIESEINPVKAKTPKVKNKVETPETNGVSPKSKPSQVNHAKTPKAKVKSISKPKKSNDSPDVQVIKKSSAKRRIVDTESSSTKSEKAQKKSKYSPFHSSEDSVYTPPPLQSYIPSVSSSSPPKQSGLLNRPSFIERAELPPLDIETVSKILEEKRVQPCMLKFGFLGLGLMGRGIVKNLINSGHHVTVWNRTPEKCKDFVKAGAFKGQTPADVVAASDITFSCVADPSAAKELVFGNCGVLQEMTLSKGYVEVTSIDPDTSQDISEAIIARGGRYLEAPVAGSRELAENGQLIVLAAGDRSLFTDCQSCFQAMGKHAFYLGGEVGNAAKMNLAYHLLMGTTVAALAEALSLAKALGIRQEDLMDIIELGPLNCQVIREKGRAIIEGKFQTSMPLQHMQKDLQLVLCLGDRHDHPLHTTASANEVYKHSKHLGYGEHDVAAIYLRASNGHT